MTQDQFTTLATEQPEMALESLAPVEFLGHTLKPTGNADQRCLYIDTWPLHMTMYVYGPDVDGRWQAEASVHDYAGGTKTLHHVCCRSAAELTKRWLDSARVMAPACYAAMTAEMERKRAA
jgi:hypothetical protein